MFLKRQPFILFILLILTLIFGSCGSSTKTKNTAEKISKERKIKHIWLSSTSRFCSSQEVCAVGEGTGRLIAEASGRKELSKIFKVRVKANTKIDSSMRTNTDKDQVISGETEEELTQQIQETSEEVLEGVVTKEVCAMSSLQTLR